MAWKKIICVAGWILGLTLFHSNAQENQGEFQGNFENTDIPMNIQEDLEQYNQTLDAKIDSLVLDLERLEFQMVRTYGKVKYKTFKEQRNKEEHETVLTDTVMTDQLTGEEQLAVPTDELQEPIDTGTAIISPEAALDDTLIVPPPPPVTSDYQAVSDLDDLRKDLNQLTQRLIFHRQSFGNALRTHEWIRAESLRTDLEIMMEEIETGIETIRGEISDFP
jgi:hypothetical protein